MLMICIVQNLMPKNTFNMAHERYGILVQNEYYEDDMNFQDLKKKYISGIPNGEFSIRLRL